MYLKELKAGTGTGVCTPMFIAALFTIAKRCKQPRCPSTDEWVSKTGIYNRIQSSHERGNILTDAATWRDLEKIMLNKSDAESQVLYNSTDMGQLKSANSQTESRNRGYQGRKRGKRVLLLHRYEVDAEDDEAVLSIDRGMGTHCNGGWEKLG